MAFRFDTQHLPAQTREIINKRDENDKLLKANTKGTTATSHKVIFPTAIFMKLGHDGVQALNGVQTMQIYDKFCKQKGTAWFSTNSLATGMSEKQREKFINAIGNGYTVEMYFAVGKSSSGNNDIQYRAEIIDIRTDANGITSPEKLLTPQQWANDKNKIWIKIKDLQLFTNLTVHDFIVESSGKILANSIEHSQYHFGYIKNGENK